MIILKNISTNAADNAAIIETKYGYIIHGHYYKKKGLSAVPLKFITQINSNKNMMYMRRNIPVLGFGGTNSLQFREFSSLIEDDYEANVYYILINNNSYEKNPLNNNTNNLVPCIYKIYETEDKFEILAKLEFGTSTLGNAGYINNMNYVGQNKDYLFLGLHYNSSSSYYYTERNLYRFHKTLSSAPTSYSYQYPAPVYQDESVILSLLSSYSTATTAGFYMFNKTDASYKNLAIVKDPDDTSYYTFLNNGIKGDDDTEDPKYNRANYNTINRNLLLYSQDGEITKYSGLFDSEEEGSIETYLPFIGDSGILDDGKVNIGKVKMNIRDNKENFNIAPTIKTCKILNKDNKDFIKWRDMVHTYNSYYWDMMSMKFENEDHTYLVIHSVIHPRQSGQATGTPNSLYVNNNIAVFEIDKNNHDYLTFVSMYKKENACHHFITPFMDDIFILVSDLGYTLLRFNYDNGTFSEINHISKGLGFLSIDSNKNIFTYDGNYNIETYRITNVPYEFEMKFEIEDTKFIEEFQNNILIKAKDLLGNNTSAEIRLVILNGNCVFTENSEKTIDITLSKDDDITKVPVTISGTSVPMIEAHIKTKFA